MRMWPVLAKVIFFVIALGLLNDNLLEASYDDTAYGSQDCLPTVKMMTKQEVESLYPDTLLTGEPRNLLMEFIDVMFKSPIYSLKRPHPPASINKGWQCLKKRLEEATTAEERVDEISKTAALHLELLKKYYPELALRIKSFPCDNCKKSAKYELDQEDLAD